MSQRAQPTVVVRSFAAGANRGTLPGIYTVHKFGHNGAIPNGSWATVWHAGGTYSWPVTAETVRVKAGGNAADTVDGAGAREVTVVGIDDSWNEVTETIVTAGALASAATTTLFFRVYRVYVSKTGTYGGTNAAAVEIENTTAAVVLGYIAAGEGQTQQGIYTVPAGYTACIRSLRLTASTNKVTNIRLLVRSDADVFTGDMAAFRTFQDWDAVAGITGFDFAAFPSFAGKTDLEFQAYGDGAVSKVSVSFDLLLIKDD